ncbi:hypothetical protein Cni_G13237 [Canna indica]|uniref:Uncharacterized protein n=1 Tax=Canna indica TaxID=4628 RepID=A0AAQ3QCI0_9LILI|nr:hypothetical protein Cni_G13237 [Canna indica]
MKTEFKDACRPIICINGCFLKRLYRGQLLSAIANDVNDEIYIPLHGLQWMLSVITVGSGSCITYLKIYVQLKRMAGLLCQINKRYLYANFKKSHPGKTLKDELWNAAKATTFNSFKACMERIKNIDQSAYD